jgi:hypothetical protein
MYDSYFFIDSDMGNPHMFQVRYQASSTIARCIMGQGGRNDQIGPLGGGTPDSGEFGFFGSYTEDGHMQTVTYCIFLPCALGYSTMELGTCNAGIPHMRDNVCDHNTWFGGWAPDAGGTTNGFGFLDFSEISNAPSNCWGSVRSNIMWNPGLAGYTSSFYKTRDMSHLQAGNPKPAVDIVTANRLDYNCGHGHTLSMASIAGVHDLTNEGNGYGGAFSVAPGAHDVDVNPDFVDWQRTMELWDSKYLGDSHAAWHPAHHYAEGDLVSHQRSDVYWSLPVNYRYIGNGANPEPGGGSNWRANWEWAALHQLRADTTSGRTYTDPTLGITDATAIQTMMAWVRKGYTPQNPHLKGAAHDGTDIGAMPMT